jgi:hypothetical protein
MRVMQTRARRSAPSVAALVVVVLGLWLGRALIDQPADTAVRHGVSTTATVMATGGGHATVRYFAGSERRVASITKQAGRSYEVGRTVRVNYDPAQVSHVSERNLPAPAGSGPRVLMLLATFAAAITVYALLDRRRPPERGDHRVGGGRERAGVLDPVSA